MVAAFTVVLDFFFISLLRLLHFTAFPTSNQLVMAPLSHISTSRHQYSSNADANQQEVGRGKTTGLSIAKKKRKSVTDKLPVFIPLDKIFFFDSIPLDKMVAVGLGASDFVTKISIIVQKNAPLNVEKWKYVSDFAKDKIVEKVMDTFDIDDTDHNKDFILDTSKQLYRNYRTRLHSHFKKYEKNELVLEHKPDTVSEDDWEYLVNYFSSAGFKAMSNRNKSNKTKQVVNHTCGRKFFQAVSYDARDLNTEKEPNFQDLWQLTYMKSNGEWVDEASKEVHGSDLAIVVVLVPESNHQRENVLQVYINNLKTSVKSDMI